MISNDAIGNDPEKERLCASRAKGTTVPFEIDERRVALARRDHPDITFIAVDGISPQLIECYLREGTGRYEPASFSPVQGYWHPLRPAGFSPGMDTNTGRAAAMKACLDAALAKASPAGFHHSVNTSIREINLNEAGKPFAGVKADRYDIAATGKLFYAAAGPDQRAVTFACLMSPSLELKALQLK